MLLVAGTPTVVAETSFCNSAVPKVAPKGPRWPVGLGIGGLGPQPVASGTVATKYCPPKLGTSAATQPKRGSPSQAQFPAAAPLESGGFSL